LTNDFFSDIIYKNKVYQKGGSSMSYVFLEIKTLHTKDNKEFYVLSVLDINNLVVQTIYVTQSQVDLLKTYSMFDDISDLVKIKFNSKSNSYQLALC
jgi:hypothetical protein